MENHLIYRDEIKILEIKLIEARELISDILITIKDSPGIDIKTLKEFFTATMCDFISYSKKIINETKSEPKRQKTKNKDQNAPKKRAKSSDSESDLPEKKQKTESPQIRGDIEENKRLYEAYIEQSGLPERFTQEDLRNLISIRYRQTSNSPEECVICFDQFQPDHFISFLSCHHRFHTTCIKSCLVKKNECPICQVKACLDL